MFQYRYILEPYKDKGQKHQCPECGRRSFVRYVDIESGEYLGEMVGRCDHENSCGYHLSPSEYFKNSCRPAFVKRYFFPRKDLEKRKKPNKFSTISDDAVMATLGHYDRNNLFIWLAETFSSRLTLETARLYRLGTSKYWNGACVFWQIDIYNRTRTGKIMLYDRWTGHRIKEPVARITWVHSLKMFKDFRLQQCFFGEHLLNLKPHAIVGIVESEKTALICSMFRNDMVWLATGGLNNLNAERCRVLKGRKVILFPDLGAEEIWEKKAAEIPALAHARISLWLRERAGQEDIERGLDLGDWVVRYYGG